MRRRFVFAWLSMLAVISAPAFAGNRQALVIGNATYPGAPLNNPVRDARAMEKALQASGFSVVTVHENLKRKELKASVNAFVDQLGPTDTAVVFYAGHGIELKGENFLLPVDFSATNEEDAIDEGYRMQTLLDRLAQRPQATNIVIFDACRNDPFSRRWSRTTQGRGFTRVDVTAGMFVAFSTAPGNVAADGGAANNSPFTQALVKHLATPGLDINDVLRKVRRDVLAATDSQQSPWSLDNLTGSFRFREGSGEKSGPVTCPTGTSWNGATCAATTVTCPPDTTWNGSACEGRRLASLPVPPPSSTSPPSSTTGSAGIVWVQLPGGSFHFGCEPQDRECESDEKPGSTQRVAPFSMAQTETTVAQYNACVAAVACERGPGNSDGGSNHPVVNVDWHEARAFCWWAGGRLPTAVEWEYAAKSGSSRIYPWGDSPPTASRANCDSFTCNDHFERTAPVGSFPEGDTRHGLKDMAGNVYEWTSSNYESSYKEFRGGSWGYSPANLRASYRNRAGPARRYDYVGFRCAQ
jgi:formylglycine-generating enzyme required for sulfatase activity